MTASAFEENREQVLTAGCDDFVHKPFKEHEIFEMMAKHLGVCYVYEEDEGQKAKSEESLKPQSLVSLTPEALKVIPSDLLNALEQATILGKIDTIEQTIKAIRSHDVPVADMLEVSANDFKYKKIWDMIQQIK